MTKFVYGTAAPDEDDSPVRPPHVRVWPEIVLRLADVSEIPASALSALGSLQRAGWAITPTYCRGFTPATGAAGRAVTPRLVDSLALRCQRLDVAGDAPRLVRAYGLWLGGAWDVGYVAVPWVRYGYREWLREMKGWAT